MFISDRCSRGIRVLAAAGKGDTHRLHSSAGGCSLETSSVAFAFGFQHDYS